MYFLNNLFVQECILINRIPISKEEMELKGVCDIIVGVLFLVMDVLEEKNR